MNFNEKLDLACFKKMHDLRQILQPFSHPVQVELTGGQQFDVCAKIIRYELRDIPELARERYGVFPVCVKIVSFSLSIPPYVVVRDASICTCQHL